ncbi:hypothetical protein EYF80_029067 [Liparis tanakae]|uniref:Uncharacterized protein n=1 Tax=Liparis tanakae TaxID=230148 RepID=A0A4Z2H6S7_9TELE|nr:hypothetical protein EYF80_029067 [Liparis tanakae]
MEGGRSELNQTTDPSDWDWRRSGQHDGKQRLMGRGGVPEESQRSPRGVLEESQRSPRGVPEESQRSPRGVLEERVFELQESAED